MFGFQLGGKIVGISLIVLAGDQLVLAARKEVHEIIEELAGYGQAAGTIELQAGKIAPEENPMVDFVEHAAVRVGIFQERLAKGMKRFQGDVLGALPDGFYHASLHLAGCFVGKGQTQNVFTREVRVRLQQVADAFGDDTSLSGARTGNHEQRPFGMRDGAPLRVIEFQARVGQRLEIKKCAHTYQG